MPWDEVYIATAGHLDGQRASLPSVRPILHSNQQHRSRRSGTKPLRYPSPFVFHNVSLVRQTLAVFAVWNGEQLTSARKALANLVRLATETAITAGVAPAATDLFSSFSCRRPQARCVRKPTVKRLHSLNTTLVLFV